MVTIECICPPTAAGETRHPDGDTVELRERLDFRSVLAARNSIAILKSDDPDVSAGEILATLTESYMLLGVAAWSVVDEKGKPVEVNSAAIRQYLFANDDAALAVADEADVMYRDRILAPLVQAAQPSSRATPTKTSTSARNGSAQTSRTPSKQSSTSTIRTDGTEAIPMSLAGASKSSQNSA